ncbi:MAG: hypothetical protein A2Y62_01770 [Candidatus Fischerbacteria bacterium RBG_13_37_8]|uniref:Soluble ligand binding domain-containing protein n=1 Tax=Candidatus Fischerbacteria bacterium RBG_13_37_8 TaxID=1817863 RepID=A0A1F5VDM9_9BACT|nr:MAG: hypothetical protein A2Y62_01770 [Candidatus Fischerbacteria bacterium RBG_13_37_8]
MIDDPIENDYIIGAEDLLEIRVFELPELSSTVRVSSDGKINIPPIGDIDINGFSKSQAEQKLNLLLRDSFVNESHAVIFIKEFRSQKIDVIGAVRKPGSYPLIARKTLLEVISEAGGLTENVGDLIHIFRKSSPHSPKIEIDLNELIRQGNPALNITVRPGDVINILPIEKITVYIYGEVGSPGAIEIKKSENTTLLKAIIKAGGPTDRANLSNATLKRTTPDGKETNIKVNIKNILKGKDKDPILLDGDIIIIPESFF